MSDKSPIAGYREALAGALEKLSRSREREEKLRSEPIAIVSMACRFPGGVSTPEQLWELLMAERDVITEVPPERFDVERYFDPDPDAAGRIYTRWGGFVEDVDLFDPGFFEVSPREAVRMDPQERFLLECTWELFERAGIVPGTLAGSSTGVYLGLSSNDYLYLDGMNEETVDAYSVLGTAHSAMAGRISYWLGLEGPNLPVDTACSSSLVSLHLACQGLRSGDCSMAIAGGVNLLLSPYGFVYFSRLKAMSPTGRCHTFSSDADGYVRSEGCGLLLLKRLSDAERDGDTIHALIRGSAVNQDGQSNGFTAPSGVAQQAVIRRALDTAGVPAASVTAVECHGTGTPLGDPIEVGALAAVYGEGRAAAEPLVLGSVKSNIGHLESAAGSAGVIKAVLALQNETIPKTLHVNEPNPHIDWDEIPVQIATDSSPLSSSESPPRMGVSAFGFSGTNAHVILEQAPKELPRPISESPPQPGVPRPLVVSGRDDAALRGQAEVLGAWLKDHPEVSFDEVVTTAALGRTHFRSRAACLVTGTEEAVAALEALAVGEPHPGVVTEHVDEPPRIAFLFTGQGSVFSGMGRELWEGDAVFRAAFDEVLEALNPHLDQDLRAVMWSEDDALLRETGFTQPALFLFEVALFRLWESWGVRPDFLLGHSIGELVAAHLAGVFTLEDAAKVVCARASLMQACPSGGAMVSVEASETEVKAWLKEIEAPVEIAGINGPRQVVLSGEEAGVVAAERFFEERSRRTSRLSVSHAFHSAGMDPMLEEFSTVLKGCTLRPPTIAVISNLTGGRCRVEDLRSPRYWTRQVREPVRFADGVGTLRKAGVTTFVECGPAGVLSALGATCVPDGVRATFVPSSRKRSPEVRAFAEALSRVHVEGVTVDWGRGERRLTDFIELPTYAFVRRRYWVEPAVSTGATGFEASGHPLLGAGSALGGSSLAVFCSSLSENSPSWMGDHRVGETVVVPGAALLEMMRAAGESAFRGGGFGVEEVVFSARWDLSGELSASQVLVHPPEEDGTRAVAIYREREGVSPWEEVATARLVPQGSGEEVESGQVSPSPGAQRVDITNLYEDLALSGLYYGEWFRGVREVWKENGDLWARLELPTEDPLPYGVHPAILDAAFHSLTIALGPTDEDDILYLPFRVRSATFFGPVGSEVWAHLTGLVKTETGIQAEVRLYGTSGELLVALSGMEFRGMALRENELNKEAPTSRYEVQWHPLPSPGATVPGRFSVVVPDGSLDGADSLAEHLRLAGASSEVSNSVSDALREGWETIVWVCSPAGDPVEAAHRLSREGLSILSEVLQSEGAGLVCLLLGDDSRSPLDAVAARSLGGLLRSARSEHPNRILRLVDASGSNSDLGPVVEAIGALEEPEVRVVGEELRVPRLERAPEPMIFPTSEPWRLVVSERGRLDRFEVESAPAEDLRPGWVRVRVRAAGVNFRDVLNALGMVPIPWLGLELAGVVTEVGPGVTGYEPGDRVMGLGEATFASFADADARMITSIPEQLSFEEAATLPLVFGTAWYALNDLGKLKEGERVLIHAAAGGVGMAAVQVATCLGAEIYGTASESKWDTLKELGVSPTRIASSRDLHFKERFEEETGGEGVDVVLNALAGEFVDASLGLLREGGRFLEMGKTDLRDAEEVKRAFTGVEYAAFELLEAGEDRIAEIWTHLGALFSEGRLTPLPRVVRSMADIGAVFRFMAQGKNIGKLVLVPPSAGIISNPRCTVLITGGLGALGSAVARFLVQEHGVRYLVLTSRHGESTPGAQELVKSLEASGARVRVASCDVSNRGDLVDVLRWIPPTIPLVGVIHAAGVVDDGALLSLNPKRLKGVLTPKVDGAWNLHRLTVDYPLEFFVLFSSIAGVLGSPGQGSYAAANGFLDGLARARSELGLPGVSIAWGPWEGDGMASGLSELELVRIKEQGISLFSRPEGLALLESAVKDGAPEPVMVHFDPRRMGRTLRDRAVAPPPLLEELLGGKLSTAPTGEGKATLGESAPEDREQVLLKMLQREIAGVLGLQGRDAVPPGASLKELGADSLMSVEIRNRVSSLLGVSLPATLVFDYPTPRALTEHLLVRLELAEAREESAPQVKVTEDEPIAVVSMACRFPGGVTTPEALWTLLKEERDAITEVPRTRFDVDAFYDPDPDATGKTYTRWGGFVGDVSRFDASFFGISPREAKSIDPQERLLLETTWELYERIGVVPESLSGSLTGVYLGISAHEYLHLGGMDPNTVDAYSILGTSHSAIAGRLSYWLGLRGPNLPVDTACSSSLVSLHLACQGLRNGDCDAAISGGVNLLLSPYGYVYFSRLQAMSPTGRCRTFSEDADGYVRGEGCGLLLLKRLSDAKRDGDEVLALVRGTAVNQDGQSNGFTAPNGPAQEAVIRRALAVAGVPPASVDYVECHGTGTPLGDPIEVGALGAVYGKDRPEGSRLMIGSVKTNIGHTESAAGVAGLQKAILSLRHREIPASLHSGVLNSKIPWGELPLTIAGEASEWEAGETPRRAGISSFGFSGTNAHVVLEEAPEDTGSVHSSKPPSGPVRVPVLLSGRDPAALMGQVDSLFNFITAEPTLNLRDVARSLATTRTHFETRAGFSVASREELLERLKAALERGSVESVKGGAEGAPGGGGVAFLFTGQGSQRPKMGRELYERYPLFRATLDQIAAQLEPHLGTNILEVMWERDGERLARTEFTQPGLFALEVGLYRLWESFGVRPALLLGHSVGEIAAAHVAGVMDLHDACALVGARATLMQSLDQGGAMASLGLDEAVTNHEIGLLGLRDVVEVAAVNSPSQTLISGDEGAVVAMIERCQSLGRPVRRINVSHAFHSHHMDPVLAPFREVCEGLTFSPPKLRLLSNLTGEVETERFASPEYWVDHVRMAVRFRDSFMNAVKSGVRLFVELGPEPILSGMGARCLDPDAPVVFAPSLRSSRDGEAGLQGALMEVHGAGAPVDWERAFIHWGGARIPIPTYAFQRERFWLDPPRGSAGQGVGQRTGQSSLSGSWTPLPEGGHLHFIPVGPSHQPYLADHVIHGQVIAAGAFHVGVLLAVAAEHFTTPGFALENIRFLRPLLVGEDRVVQVWVLPKDDRDGYQMQVLTLDEDAWGEATWSLYVEAEVSVGEQTPRDEVPLEAARSRCTREVDVPGYYNDLAAIHISWGPLWRWTTEAFAGLRGEGGFLTLDPPAGLPVESLPLHPVAIDNGFAALGLGLREEAEDDTPQLPFAISEVAWYRAPKGRLRSYTEPLELGDDNSVFNVSFWDEGGDLVAELFRCTIKRAPGALMLANAGADPLERLRYEVRWQELGGEGDGAGGSWTVVGDPAGPLALEVVSGLTEAGVEVTEIFDIATGEAPGTGSRIVVWEQHETGIIGAPDTAALALGMLQKEWAEERSGDVVWVTRGAVGGPPDALVSDPGSACLWGMVRTSNNERPEGAVRLIDVGSGALDSGAFKAALGQVNEQQCVCAGGAVWVPALVRALRNEDLPDLGEGLGGTVLITGGLGALGREVALWLCRDRGVKHLLLTSRRGEDSVEAPGLREELLTLGAEVSIVAADVANREELKRALNSIPENAPLRGVIHAAGVLDDGVIPELNEARLGAVLAPKVSGAWNLHELTAGAQLDFFVLFSSFAGVIGSMGQGNYASANAFLDALAYHRRGQGEPAVSVAWGPFESEGMASSLGAAERGRMSRQGLTPLGIEEGMRALGDAIDGEDVLRVVVDLNPARLQKSLERSGNVPGIYRQLVRLPTTSGTTSADLRRRLTGLPDEDRLDALVSVIGEEIAVVLGLSSGREVDSGRSLQDLGIDSLMGVELSKRMVALTGLKLPSTLVFDYPTPGAIAEKLLEDLLLPDSGGDSTMEEEELRRLLLGIDPARLREAGLIEVLKGLAEPAGEEGTGDKSSLATKDVERLSDAEVEDELDALLGELL